MHRLLLVVVLLAAVVAPARAEQSSLERFQHQKYPPWMLAVTRDAVQRNFPGATPAEREQAIQETLAFFHVVYHTTRHHHVEQNIALAQTYERQIREACLLYGVPPQMALSIISWENGGSLNVTSWAACSGLGQLSEGAVHQAHRYYKQAMRELVSAAVFFDLMADLCHAVFHRDHAIEYLMRTAARRLRAHAARIDLDKRHEKLRKAAKVKDERMVAECNIEDSVVFMKLLLDAYGNRIDLAISAYHNGQGNNDDLLRDYLRRVDPPSAAFTAQDRGPLLRAIRDRRITFLTLWNDRRCREMLNGLRTMDGDPTTDANRSQALGDESDIYVWKCTGALAGFLASPSELALLVDLYRDDQDLVETRGFRFDGSLVTVAKGVRVTPEMAGWLHQLGHRFKSRTGKNLDLKLAAGHLTSTHAEGLAVDILAGGGPALAALLYEDWLFDRIYRERLSNGHLHVCLNPRFGGEFLKAYQARQKQYGALGGQ